jgi:hypothetical protein
MVNKNLVPYSSAWWSRYANVHFGGDLVTPLEDFSVNLTYDETLRCLTQEESGPALIKLVVAIGEVFGLPFFKAFLPDSEFFANVRVEDEYIKNMVGQQLKICYTDKSPTSISFSSRFARLCLVSITNLLLRRLGLTAEFAPVLRSIQPRTSPSLYAPFLDKAEKNDDPDFVAVFQNLAVLIPAAGLVQSRAFSSLSVLTHKDRVSQTEREKKKVFGTPSFAYLSGSWFRFVADLFGFAKPDDNFLAILRLLSVCPYELEVLLYCGYMDYLFSKRRKIYDLFRPHLPKSAPLIDCYHFSVPLALEDLSPESAVNLINDTRPVNIVMMNKFISDKEKVFSSVNIAKAKIIDILRSNIFFFSDSFPRLEKITVTNGVMNLASALRDHDVLAKSVASETATSGVANMYMIINYV